MLYRRHPDHRPLYRNHPGNVGISADEEPLDIISGYNDYKITSQDFNKLVFNGTYTNADHAMYLNEEKNTIYRTNNRGGSENQAIQIILNANFGDSAETVEQSLTPGEETLLIPAPFAREGYTFTGWSPPRPTAAGHPTPTRERLRSTMAVSRSRYTPSGSWSGRTSS